MVNVIENRLGKKSRMLAPFGILIFSIFLFTAFFTGELAEAGKKYSSVMLARNTCENISKVRAKKLTSDSSVLVICKNKDGDLRRVVKGKTSIVMFGKFHGVVEKRLRKKEYRAALEASLSSEFDTWIGDDPATVKWQQEHPDTEGDDEDEGDGTTLAEEGDGGADPVEEKDPKPKKEKKAKKAKEDDDDYDVIKYVEKPATAILIRERRPSRSARITIGYDDVSGARGDLEAIIARCSSVDDDIEARDEDITTTVADFKAKIAEYEDAIKAEKEAKKAMLEGCRNECLLLALEEDDCKLKDKDRLKFLQALQAKDIPAGSAVRTKVVEVLKITPEEEQALTDKTDEEDSLCSLIYGSGKRNAKNKCRDFMFKDWDCEAAEDWIAAVKLTDDLEKEYKALLAKKTGYDKKRTKSQCTLTASNVDSVIWDVADADCLVIMKDSCDKAIQDGRAALSLALHPPYCPTCGTGADGSEYGYCPYGNCVSKGAQWAAALGGPLAYLGGQFVNLALGTRGMRSCNSGYNSYLDYMKPTGIPVAPPQCGLAGAGMPGFGAGNGLGMGIGMNPMMNPMMGGQWPGMYGPMANGQMPGMFGPMAGMQAQLGMQGMQQMPGNMMTVQQQMMDAQMRMAGLASQNSIYQQGMYGGISGLNSPYFGMGMQGGPGGLGGYGGLGGGLGGYGGLGAYGGLGGAGAGMYANLSPFGANAGLYANGGLGGYGGYGGYDPLMGGGAGLYGGMGAGLGGGYGGYGYGGYSPFASGLNLNFNASMGGGLGGYGGYGYYI